MKKDIIFLDTETTNLTESIGVPLEYQPYIIEICCIRTNWKATKIKGRFQSYIRPPIPIPTFITKITGIDDYKVMDSPNFKEILPDLQQLFLGAYTMVAHNLSFDRSLIYFELLRIAKECSFPWPPDHFCTVEQSMFLKGFRLKLNELYHLATEKQSIQNAHSAEGDTLALIDCYKFLKGL